MTPRQHLDLVGLLLVLWGALMVAIGAFLFLVMGLGAVTMGLGMAGAGSGGEETLIVSGIYGAMAVFSGLFLAAFGLPYLLVGFALRRRKAWARIPGIILGALALTSVPLGTILGIYAIMKLLDTDVRALLESSDPDPLA